MPAIHLDVVKLEGDRKRCLYPMATVFSPHNHRIAKLIGVLVYNTIQFRLYHCRSSNNHTIFKERTLTLSSSLRCQFVVFLGEFLGVIGVCNVTRIYSPFAIVYNYVYGNAVVLEEFVFFG